MYVINACFPSSCNLQNKDGLISGSEYQTENDKQFIKYFYYLLSSLFDFTNNNGGCVSCFSYAIYRAENWQYLNNYGLFSDITKLFEPIYKTYKSYISAYLEYDNYIEYKKYENIESHHITTKDNEEIQKQNEKIKNDNDKKYQDNLIISNTNKQNIQYNNELYTNIHNRIINKRILARWKNFNIDEHNMIVYDELIYNPRNLNKFRSFNFINEFYIDDTSKDKNIYNEIILNEDDGDTYKSDNVNSLNETIKNIEPPIFAEKPANPTLPDFVPMPPIQPILPNTPEHYVLGGNYKNKYLKYKNKYLKLKKMYNDT